MRLSTRCVHTSKTRLPYEKQSRNDIYEGDSSSTLSSDDADDDGPPMPELLMRLSAIRDISDHFCKLSFRIRNPSLRPESSQAMLYRELVDIAVDDVSGPRDHLPKNAESQQKVLA